MDVQIIGDEIWADGFLVGLLVQTGAPATVIGAFTDGVNSGDLFKTAQDEDSESNVPEKSSPPSETSEVSRGYGAALKDVSDSLKPYVKGGLIRVADVEKVVLELGSEIE